MKKKKKRRGSPDWGKVVSTPLAHDSLNSRWDQVGTVLTNAWKAVAMHAVVVPGTDVRRLVVQRVIKTRHRMMLSLSIQAGRMRNGWVSEHGASRIALAGTPNAMSIVVLWSRGSAHRRGRWRRVVDRRAGHAPSMVVVTVWRRSVLRKMRLLGVLRSGKLVEAMAVRGHGRVALVRWVQRAVCVHAGVDRSELGLLASPGERLRFKVFPLSLPHVETLGFGWIQVQSELESRKPVLFQTIQVLDGDTAHLSPRSVDEGVVIEELASKKKTKGDDTGQLHVQSHGLAGFAQLYHASVHVVHAHDDGRRRQTRGRKDAVNPLAGRWLALVGWQDDALSDLGDEFGHGIHLVVELAGYAACGLLFARLLSFRLLFELTLVRRHVNAVIHVHRGK